MFDQLLALVTLGEKLPDAVGWRLAGPYQLSIPEEMLERVSNSGAGAEGCYTIAAIAIYNYSGVAKSEVRVLYSGNFEFKPKVSYGRRDAPVRWEHDAENKELIFHDVPPDENIEIELFNLRGFSVDKVLVDGKLVTELMNKRAFAKAYPVPIWFKASMAGFSLFSAVALVVIIYFIYIAQQRDKDYELMSEAPPGYSSCTPYMYENPPGTESKEILSRKLKKMGAWMGFVLAKNKVETEDELYGLDRVFLCSPSNQG